MSNSYKYSIAVDEALRNYGARTHGSLERRVERLKRFTDMKNKQYAAEIRLEEARRQHDQSRQDFLKALDTRYNNYNLRSRSDPEYGLKLLVRAIQNGFVNTKRG